MTVALYFSIAAVVMIITIATILALVDHFDGSIDGKDFGMASFLGLLIGLIWIVSISALILAGAGYCLFLLVKSAITRYDSKKS